MATPRYCSEETDTPSVVDTCEIAAGLAVATPGDHVQVGRPVRTALLQGHNLGDRINVGVKIVRDVVAQRDGRQGQAAKR